MTEGKRGGEGGRENSHQWQAGRRSCGRHPETSIFRHPGHQVVPTLYFPYSNYIVLIRTHSNSLPIVPIDSASFEQGQVLHG